MTENWNNEIIGKIPLLNIRQFDIRRFQALSGKDNLSVCDLEVLAAASIWQNNRCFYIKTIRYNHYIIVLSALGELILEDLKKIELYGCGRALDTNYSDPLETDEIRLFHSNFIGQSLCTCRKVSRLNFCKPRHYSFEKCGLILGINNRP